MDGEGPFDSLEGNAAFTRLVQKALAAAASLSTPLAQVNELQLDTAGAGPTAGVATLVSGTVTVATTRVVAGSVILLSPRGNTAAGDLDIQTITPGVSFVIRSSSGTDARDVAWAIINPIV